MKASGIQRFLGVFLAFVVLNLPSTASACAVCMGDPNTRSAGAINAAIFLMLGFIFSMLGCLIAFGIYLYKRSQAEVPPHVQLAEMIGSASK